MKSLEESLEGIELKEDKEKVYLEETLYWKWKFNLERYKSSTLNLKRANLEKELMSKNLEIQKLKLSLYKDTLLQADSSRKISEENYKSIIEELGKNLGFEFKNCIVDEETLEVKKIDELEKTNQTENN